MEMLKMVMSVLACIEIIQGLEVSKRRLDQFAEMIHLVTGKDASDYNSYGNWCGPGGEGKTMDAVDKCCKTHDLCYNSIVDKNICKQYETWLSAYEYKKDNNTITCTHATVPEVCLEALCKCDKTAVLCFKEHVKDWNLKNKKWSGLDSLIKFLTG